MAIKDKDICYTPHWCFESLEPFIDWSKIESFLEPCCGDSRITRWLMMKSQPIFSGECDINHEVPQLKLNYLKTPYERVDLILTNPPYSKALQFTKKAIQEANCVIMLHRLGFLASQNRHPFWIDNPPSALVILSTRPSFFGKGTDNSDYAWIVWDKMDIFKLKRIHHIL